MLERSSHNSTHPSSALPGTTEEYFEGSDRQSDTDSDLSIPRPPHSSRGANHKHAKWLVRVAGSALDALQDQSHPGGTEGAAAQPPNAGPEIQDEIFSLRKQLLALRQSGAALCMGMVLCLG